MALSLLFASPWIAWILWLWRTTPRDAATFPSLAERARSRV